MLDICYKFFPILVFKYANLRFQYSKRALMTCSRTPRSRRGGKRSDCLMAQHSARLGCLAASRRSCRISASLRAQYTRAAHTSNATPLCEQSRNGSASHEGGGEVEEVSRDGSSQG